jgi:hypothetical protein
LNFDKSIPPDREGDGHVLGFDPGRIHLPSPPLAIAPSLEWHTFLGSEANNWGYDVAVDGNGNVYVTGYSEATWGSPVNPYAGDEDVFVAKLNSSGVLQWNTFLGSADTPGRYDDDRGEAIAVDGDGNVYVSGESSSTWGSPVNAHTGNADVFVAKLDSNGVLQWNTFYGSDNPDTGRDLAVDDSGNTYITGETGTQWSGPYAYVLKLDTDGVRQWDTLMGSSQGSKGWAVTVDGDGNSYVVGHSDESWGDPISPYTSDGESTDDGFVAKLDSGGTVQWNAFLGSAEDDQARGIAVDGSRNIYVSGYSEATWGSPVNPHDGFDDDFVAKLNNDGALQWNTFLHTYGYNYGRGVVVDGGGNTYLAGESRVTWGSPSNPYAGGYDVYAVKLNNSGNLQWNTFLGSAEDEWGNAIAVDTTGNIYLTGMSGTTWGSPVNPHPGGWSVLVAKLGVAPEIDLQGNGQSIPDNDPSPTPADGSDFGLVPWDGGTMVHTFTIQNNGDAELNLTGSPLVEITGTHAGDFTVTAQPASSVAPGASTSFAVRFDPGAIGTRSAAISIANNDNNETPYNFAIQGTGALAVYLPLVLR